MNLNIVVHLRCPVCDEDRELVPDQFLEGIYACGAVCDVCNHRLNWNPEQMYLASFTPDNVIRQTQEEEASPVMRMTIQSMEPKE